MKIARLNTISSYVFKTLVALQRIKIRHSIEPRDRINVKGYAFLSFAKSMGKSLSIKYGQKNFDSAKKSTADLIKTASKRQIQKTAEANGDLISNKIADKIARVSKKKPAMELHSKELPNNNDEADVEYQKIANLLSDASTKPSKFRSRNWVEINDDIRGAYSPDKQIKFKTSMLRSSLCDYSDAYILVKGNISVNNNAGAGATADNTNKKVIFKNCAPFTNCISKINNAQIDNAEYIDIVMPM